MIALRMVWFTSAVAILGSVLSSVGRAETLRYHPAVGNVFYYGIDYVLTCQDEHPEPQLRVRCIVCYTIIAVDADHWEASFETFPFHKFAPYRDQTEILNMIKKLDREDALFDQIALGQDSLPNHLKQQIEAERAAARARAQQRRITQIRNLKEYRGLFQFCKGRMRVSYQGELLASSQPSQTPMLMGPVVSLPLLRLSKKDESESFGYRIVHDVTLRNARNTESTKSSFALLQTVTPTTSEHPALATVDIETEIAGGLSGGAELRVTGSGQGAFSRELGMPMNGNMKYSMSGLTYAGGHTYELQVTFSHINAWQHKLFDAMLEPNSEALSTKNLPRLTPQQVTNVRKYFATPPGPAGLWVDRALYWRAPLAYDSPEWKLVDDMANLDKASALEKIDTDERRHNLRDAIETARALRARWIRLWKLASIVHREWSDTSGSFSVNACMLSCTSTHVVLQRSDNEQRIEVPLARLSEEDREIAMTFGLTPEVWSVINEKKP